MANQPKKVKKDAEPAPKPLAKLEEAVKALGTEPVYTYI